MGNIWDFIEDSDAYKAFIKANPPGAVESDDPEPDQIDPSGSDKYSYADPPNPVSPDHGGSMPVGEHYALWSKIDGQWWLVTDVKRHDDGSLRGRVKVYMDKRLALDEIELHGMESINPSGKPPTREAVEVHSGCEFYIIGPVSLSLIDFPPTFVYMLILRPGSEASEEL